MKKFFLLTFGAYISISAIAQWTTSGNNIYYNTGNVGIGTSSPTSKLHVLGDRIVFNSNTENSYLLQGMTDGSSTGSLGISLHSAANPSSPYLWIATSGSSWAGPAGKMIIASTKNSGTARDLWIYANDNISPSAPNILVQANTGNVGIGTTNPGSYKLAVEGKIAARELKITLTSFADYVFDEKYKLRSLSALEDFILKNKHLPGVPSASEVQKNGGFEVGQLNIILLEKVEELSLYVIQLQKEIEMLKSRVIK